MASFPIALRWTPITSGKVFEWNYSDESGGEIPGLGVMASLDGDAIWRGVGLMPDPLPSTGTATAAIWGRANATSGVAKVNTKWVCQSSGAALGAATPVAEGVDTYTWSSGQSNYLKRRTIVLDASTLTAGAWIKVDLTFETSSWTLAAKSWWWLVISWE